MNDADGDAILAIDIGGTKINAAVVNADPTSRLRAEVVASAPTPAAEGPDAVIAAMIATGRRALELSDGTRIAGVGVAAAGVIDTTTGTVIAATDALPGWPGVRIAQRIGEAFDAECWVLNDVHAHGLGEKVAGAGRDVESLLLVAVGTGVGGAYIIGSQPDLGAHSVAGHIGHVPVPEAAGVPCSCGRVGHLEGFASGTGIAAEYARRHGQTLTTREIADAAASGQRVARDLMREAGFATGRVIGGALNLLDPAVVAITGGVSEAGAFWWDALRAGVAHDAMDVVAHVPVVLATGGNHAALVGVAHWARLRLYPPDPH